MQTTDRGQSRASIAKARPLALPTPVLPELPHIDGILDAARVLGIPVTAKQIDGWFTLIKSHSPDIEGIVAKQTGSEFLGSLVAALNTTLSFEDGGGAALHPALIAKLKSKLAGVSYPKRERLSDLLSRPEGFVSRRTQMNTTTDRSLSLDLPVMRFLDGRSSAEPAAIVDIGVGYPPETTIQTARVVQGRGKVIGVDSTMPDVCVEFQSDSGSLCIVFYELRQRGGRFVPVYALEDMELHRGVRIYGEISGERLEYVLRKSEELRSSMMRQIGEEKYVEMSRLQQSLQSGAASPAAASDKLERFFKFSNVSEGDSTLKFQPMRRQSRERENLEFRKDDFRLATIENADVIRFGNVLLKCYYSTDEAVAALKLAARKLNPSGIVIIASGDDNSLTYERRGDSLIPVNCTVRLSKRSPPYDSGIEFPGTKGLAAAIAAAHDSVRYDAPGIGYPMSRNEAEMVRTALRVQGYDSSYFMKHDAMWLEIKLPRL